MTRLTCTVSNCINNENNLCCRPDIKVDGSNAHDKNQTCCHSFNHRSDCVTASMAANTPCEQTQVRCDACECAYNENTVCTADCICVEGDGACDCQQTCCGSFRCGSK